MVPLVGAVSSSGFVSFLKILSLEVEFECTRCACACGAFDAVAASSTLGKRPRSLSRGGAALSKADIVETMGDWDAYGLVGGGFGDVAVRCVGRLGDGAVDVRSDGPRGGGS